MKKSLRNVLISCLLISPFLVSCASTTAMSHTNTEDAVKEMFSVMDLERQFQGGFNAMLPLIDDMSVRFNLDNAGTEELKDIYRAWFNEDIDNNSVISKMVTVYAEAFTTEEIVALTEFYSTPVGQKFLQKSPELMQIGAQIGMQEAESKQQQLLNRLEPFFKKHNIK